MSQKATNSAPAPRAPRWIKTLGLVALVLIILFVGIHLMGYGFGGNANHAQPASVIAHERHYL